jgi:mono/diheme cytochrome c family protein
MPRVLLLFLLGVLGAASASPLVTETQADASKGDARKGRVLFVKYCTGCHGTGGQGDGYRLLGPSPADLTRPSTAARSDAELLKTIHEGKPNMPAWRFRFSDEEGRDVLAYVRTLGRK